MPDSLLSYISELTGLEVTRIELGLYSISLQIDHNEVFLNVMGAWALFDNDGKKIDGNVTLENRVGFELWRIVGAKVAGVSCNEFPDSRLRLWFGNGLAFETWDEHAGYTDWELHTPKGKLISDGGLHQFGPINRALGR